MTTLDETRPPRTRPGTLRLAWALAGTVLVWALAIVTVLLPLPFVGTYVGLAASVVSWFCLVSAGFVLGLVGGRRWVTATTTGLTVVLAAGLLNWCSVAPEAWFDSHRSLYEQAVEDLEPDNSYDGALLPMLWRPLSVTGRVQARGSMLFFPQWQGIPDDAGGYFHAPDGSPAGTDMSGMICQDPVALGDDWWMCGM
ncbi:hypothetical protein [Nocardioides sp.]|uniref:hypothetical protein n=1 Tax=Nocardioides sp. TaxID=35761 RepID=UPI0027239B0F|nr:hypothetical protein [Nocardioides sp.]MDO9456926.1 hypothetical protein [Nocardioides sp.]